MIQEKPFYKETWFIILAPIVICFFVVINTMEDKSISNKSTATQTRDKHKIELKKEQIDTYYVNQDCYFGVSYDALVKATKLAASGDYKGYKGVRQMEAQGLIFMPDQGWEVVIKSYKNNGKVVCVSPVNGSGSFWGFKAYITKWVLK